MKTVSITFTAGQRIEMNLAGDFFHLLETTGPVDIEFRKLGATAYEATGMEFGFFTKPTGGFTSLVFNSASAQTIKIAYGLGDGGYNRTTGSVAILNQQGLFTQSRASVTNNAQDIVAADASRRYLMIQNNDSTAVLRFRLDGNAATPSQGFRIQPGNSYELNGYQSTAAISAIMETASAEVGNVEFVTG